MNRRSKNAFELEALEPRVLLSADALLVSVVAANAVAHKPVEVHQHAGGTLQDSLAFSPSHETSGIFEGVSSQAIQTIQSPVTESTPVQSPAQTPANNPASTTTAATQTQAATTIVSNISAAKILTASSNSTTPGADSTTTPAAQSQASLNTANGPPANSSTTQTSANQLVTSNAASSNTATTGTSTPVTNATNPVDIFSQIISDINNTNSQSGGSTHTTSYGPFSGSLVGGAITFTGVTFTMTLNGSNDVSSVAVTATGASLTLGGATASVGSVSLSFNMSNDTYSITLNNFKVALSSFINIGASSVSLTYVGQSNGSVISNTVDTVNPSNMTTPTSTDTVTMMTLAMTNAYVFAGVGGTSNASSTAPTQPSTAQGISISGVTMALAVMSSTTASGAVYYALSTSGGTVTLDGMPNGFTFNLSNLAVQLNGSNTAANGYVVDFYDTPTNSAGFTLHTGLSISTGGTPATIVLAFNQPLVAASATVDLNLNGFVYVMGGMSFQTGTSTSVNLTDGASTSDDGGSVNVSLLEIAANNVTVFAGINGPTSSAPGTIPSNAVGVEINNATFALALMMTSSGTTYYGLQASLGSATNLITGTPSYTSGTYTLTGLTPGGTYQWTAGSTDDTSITVGGTTYTASDTSTSDVNSFTFVVPTSDTTGTVTLNGTGAVNAAVTAVNGVMGIHLPAGITITGNLSVAIDAGVTSTGTATTDVVDFNTSFSTTPPSGPAYGGLTIQTSATSGYLDFAGPEVSVSGSLTLDFNGFVYITGNIAFQSGGITSGTLNLTNGTSASTTTVKSMLEVGASNVTIFAGVGGPGTNSGAQGVELENASFALAMIYGNDGFTYYGLEASADSLAAVGLPAGFNMSGTGLQVAINGSNNVNSGVTTVIDFDTSFTTGTGGKGLLVPTGGTNTTTLDFTAQYLQVSGTDITLQFGSYISISGGFSYTYTASPSTVNIVVGTVADPLTLTLGTSSSTLFTASGTLNMTITGGYTTINSATLTVPQIKVGEIVDVTAPFVSLTDVSINNSTGALSTTGDSTLTIQAVSATLFSGSSVLSGSVGTYAGDPTTATYGFNGTFNLSSGAFTVTLGTFTLKISTVMTAVADDVDISYTPGQGASVPIITIKNLTATFNSIGGGDITGNVTQLVIFEDGFSFASATLSYTGTLTLGSLLKLTNPSVTLDNFSVTFDGTNTTLSASSLTVSVDSASVTVGAFSASATGLSITVSLTNGATTIMASSLDFVFGSYLSITATGVSINTSPGNGNAYLTVGSASATVSAGSFSVTGTVTGTPNAFSVIDNNGTAEFQAGTDFTISLTTPTSSQLSLPSWLGISVTQFTITWTNFNTDPSNFQITLSASITSIQGLPGGVTVSGEITDAVIDPSLLAQGEFPIVSIGSVGGSVSGTLFGMQVNASFVLGLVSFNAENEIVENGNVYQLMTNQTTGAVTEVQVTSSPDTTVKNTILYVGVAGGATIPGVGGVQIYIGFSQLGPLTLYLSAQFPLILDPDTGLAIGGFSGGVTFDYTIPTPQQPTDLKTLSLSPAGITISQWQQQLRDQTVVQYTSSNGGTNLSAAYSQPFVIEAGVTIYDAYLSADAFTLTGNIAIQINPANTDNVEIFAEGTLTFGASVSFNAYLYLNINATNPSAPQVTVMFLADAPAATPIETIGGTLVFGFTDAEGNPISPTPLAPTIESMWIAANSSYNGSGTDTLGELPAGTYTWTPGTNDISLTVGTTVYDASSATNGTVTITVSSAQSTETTFLTGTANTVITGTLGSAGTVTGAAYTITVYTPPPVAAGFYIQISGFAEFGLSSFPALGNLDATIEGTVTLTVTTTFAEIALSGDLSVTGLGDLATATGELVVDYAGGLSGLEIYGALQLATGSGLSQLQSVGLYVSGAATFVLNTTDSPQTVYLPDPDHPTVTADATEFQITDTQSFEVTIAGVGSTPANPTYASLSYMQGGDTILSMQGSFDLKISSSGLTMFADINSLVVGPSATPYATFSGFGLFVINSQGFAAEMDLSIMANNIQGFTFNAQFTLVINTTQEDVTYTIPATLPPVTIPGTTTTVTSLTIPAGPPQGTLQADGTYATVGPTGPYVVIEGQGSLNIYSYSFTGNFYFQMSDSSNGPIVELYANVMGNIGFGTVNVTGGFELSSAGVVVLLEASRGGGSTSSFGPGVTLAISAELAVNTTDAPISSIGGIALTDTNGNPLTIAARSAQVVASGTLTMSIGPGTLVINGIFSTNIVTTGSGISEVVTTTISVDGTLTATVGGTTLIEATAVGVLVFAAPGPGNTSTLGTNGLGLAGELTLTLTGSDPLSGTGFSFNGTFDLEINTTMEAQQVMIPGDSSAVTISAGPDGSTFASTYVEIHANGTLLFGTNTGTTNAPIYNGFVLSGDFYLTVGSAGLAVSANVNLGIYITSGTPLFSITGLAAMSITSSGFAASLVITSTITDPNNLYAFGGTLMLEVNTTGVQQTIGSVVIPAAPGLTGTTSLTGSPYFQIYISGTLALGSANATVTTSSTGMYVAGNFVLTISPSGLSVAANGTLTAYVQGTALLTMQASGALIINSAGIAGELTLTVSEGTPLDSSLYSFSGTFTLILNTTGNNYYIGSDGTIYTSTPPTGTTYVTISAGADGSMTTPGSFYFEVEASGTLTFGTATNGFSLAGNLFFVVSSEGLAVSANATFTANVLGTTLLTMNASGALLITSAGIAGELTLTFAAGANDPLDGLGFGFTGSFYLALNTTGNNYYVQSNGSITTTSAGAVYTISAGANGDTTTPGTAYFEIDANGTLTFGTASNGFNLTGDLFLSVGTAGLAVSTNDTFSVNVGGSSVISLTASGAMEITSAGLAASLTLTASSGDSLFSSTTLPFGFSGVFTFQLNTTGKMINDTVGSVQLVLPKGPYFQLYVSGTLGLGTSNTSAATGLFLSGTFYLTISANGLAIAATANLTATFDGTTLLTLGATGGLVLTSSGLAGAINLTIGSSNPLSGSGFSFTGTFTLQVNTTETTYYFWSNGTVSTNAPNSTTNPGVSVITTVSAGPGGSSTGSVYFQVFASGALVVGSSSNGFSLSGSFYLAIGSAGLMVSTDVSFSATVLGTTLFSATALGAMEITPAGLAASFSLTIGTQGLSSVFTLTGTFAFQINTTNQQVTMTVPTATSTTSVTLAAGPYFQLSVGGPGPTYDGELMFGGSGAGFGLTGGSFVLTISSNGLAVSVTATLGVTIGNSNTPLVTFSATGALLITSNGIAAKLSLTLATGFSDSDYSFSATFVLELNTTSSAINSINNVAVNLPRGPYFEILGSGMLVLGGSDGVDITGSFTFTLSTSGMLIAMNASVSVFGISFNANGFAAIYTSGGLALDITLSVGNSTNPTVTIIPGILALSGSFTLQINTTSNSNFNVNGTNYTITAGTIFNISVSASLDVFGFSLATAAINISLVTGVNAKFVATGTTSFNFFGFATFGVDFYFSANLNNGNVQYWFYGGVYLQLGSGSFNIHGSLTFEVSNVNTTDNVDINNVHGDYYGQTITSGITISINGGVTAFGYNFASIGASISINGTDVSFSVYVSISFYFFSIGGTVTIDLGSIIPVPAPPPPPTGTQLNAATTIDGQSFGSGTLLINLGQYANANRGVAPLADENYTITYVSAGTVTNSEDVTVAAVGVDGGAAQTYDNVTEIVLPDPDIGNGTSNVTFTTSGPVNIPIVAFDGSGDNVYNLSGSTGSFTITGSSGNDTVHAGGGSVTFMAGSGMSVFDGGSGSATITGSTGNITVVGGTGNVTFTLGSGTNSFTGGGTGSTHNTIIDPNVGTTMETGYSYYALIGTSSTAATLYYGSSSTLSSDNSTVLTGSGITVDVTGQTSGAQTFYVSNYWGSATLDAANNSNTVTTTINSPSGNLSLTGNIVTESGTNGPTGTITLQSTGSSSAYTTLTLEGSGSNTFTINSWSGSGTVTVDGNNDDYVVNFQNTGSYTVSVSDSGTTGSLNIYGSSNADAINVTNSEVYTTDATPGTQTASYTGIGSLTVNTEANSQTVDVASTSVATTIDTTGYTDTINVGSNVLTTNTSNTLGNIASVLTVNGTSSYDTLNLDDSGDTSSVTGTLTASGLTGGMFGTHGSLSYTDIQNLNLKLGSGTDKLYITGTSSVTGINASLGTNTIDIGSSEPSLGGTLSSIAGALTITGNVTTPATTVNVDDTGSVAANGVLTSTTLKGLFMNTRGITYSGVSVLTISLGGHGNTFTINSTSSTTTTTLNSGTGADNVTVNNDEGTTIINGQGGGDTINIIDDGAATTINESSGTNTISIEETGTGDATDVNTTSGTDTIYIGSKAPLTDGSVNGILGEVDIAGDGNDIVNVDDTGSAANKTGMLTSSALTGLSMGTNGIVYSDLATLNISLGSGNYIMNVLSTATVTVTTINTGTGTNTVVNVTSNAPFTTGGVVSGIAGELIVQGQGTDTLNVNDTGDGGAGTLTQTTTTLIGLGMGANGIVYYDITTLNIYLGANNNTIYIQGNHQGTTENLTPGTGANTISIGSSALSSITTNPTTGIATNTNSVLNNISSTININDTGNDTLVVDDSGDTVPLEGGMWNNMMEFLNPATNYRTVKATITYTGISAIYISLGSGNSQFVIDDTFTPTATSPAAPNPAILIDGNTGNDTFLIFDTHAEMTMNGGSGNDNFYIFGNSAVLNLNGDTGNDNFYIYASLVENTTSVGTGSGSSKVYSYRVNSPVNINGGTGDSSVYIFGTVISDTFYITNTGVYGAGLTVNLVNIKHLVIEGLNGNNVFYIESLNIPLTIYGNGSLVLPQVQALLNALGLTLPDTTGGATPSNSFNDTFYIGAVGAMNGLYFPDVDGSLAGIDAPITIYGSNGPGTTPIPGAINTIYLDDSADTQNQNFNLTSATANGGGVVTGSAFGTTYLGTGNLTGSLTYDNDVGNLNFQLGYGSNAVTVDGNDTGIQTSIYGGRGANQFTVNDSSAYAWQAPVQIYGGLSVFQGNTLTVVGDTAGNTFNITGFTIDSTFVTNNLTGLVGNLSAAMIDYEELQSVTINAGGPTTYNVNGDSTPTFLNGGTGADNFNVNSNVVSLTLSSGTGNDTYDINNNAGILTVDGGLASSTAVNDVTVNGNSGTLTINGGPNGDTFTIDGNSGGLTINGGAGNDIFTVNALSAPATLDGNGGNNSFTVNTPLAAVLTVNGGGGSGDWLTVNGSTGSDSITVTPGVVSGLGSNIDYSATNLAVYGISGNDTFQINGTSSFITKIYGGTYGNDTFNVQANTGTLDIYGGSTGNNVYNLGSLAPFTGGVLTGLVGAINITGGTSAMRLITLAVPPTNTLNVDDTGDNVVVSGTLTSSTLTGLGMGAGVTFVSIGGMNIKLGSANDTFNVQSTNATTVTSLWTGSGADRVNIGSTEPITGGIVDGVKGPLYIYGAGEDTMYVDDTGSPGAKTGTLTPTTLTGLNMGSIGITYYGFSAMTISLGGGNNTFTILNTTASTVTTLNTGGGTDTVNVVGDSDTTTINTQGGNDTVNIQTTNATTNVNNTAGADTINIGNIIGFLPIPLPGELNSIQGTINVTGDGSDTMNVNDLGSTAAKTGTLTSSTITGLGMGSGGITYSGLANLNINLGHGGNTFTIASTYVSTATLLNNGSGNDTVYVQTTSGPTTVNADGGTNTVYIGSLEPTTGGNVNEIQGTLAIIGSGNDTMYVDDTGSTTAKTGTLTSSTITGLGMGSGGITYNGLANLYISLGSHGNVFTIASTYLSTVTTLNSGNGNNKVYVQTASDTTTVNTGIGTNTVYIGSLEPTTGGNVNGIQGALTINGSGNDTMYVDDTGTGTAKTGTLTATTITGLGMGSGGITYNGLVQLNISLGNHGNTFTISATNSGTTTNLNTGGGNDTVNVETTSSLTTVNTGGGTNTVYVGSNGSAGNGIVNGIQGALTIVGSGSDTMYVDDTGSTAAKSGTLTGITLTGLGMGTSGITYSGLEYLYISLGSGGNTFNISNTNSSTTTTLNSGTGSDTVNLTTDSSATTINTQAGTDTVNVTNDTATTTINTGGGNDKVNIRATHATTNVNNSAGADTINIGSNAPSSNGNIIGIQGTINVTGDGSDTMNVDDTGSTAAKTGTLTASALTGLGMGSGGITYSGLTALNISLGSGGNTFTISNTSSGTTTTLNSGSGSDTVNLTTDSGTTIINTQTGTDTVNVTSDGAATTINTGGGSDTVNINATNATTNVNNTGGADTINIGSNQPSSNGIVNNIQGTINVTGDGSDTLNVDDTGSTAAKTGTLTANALTGLGMGGGGITYSGLTALNASLGSGGTILLISSTSSATTHIYGGSGNDTFNVRATTGTLYLNGNGGNNIYNFGSLEPGTGGVLSGIAGAVYISGQNSGLRLLTLASGTNIVNVDDSGDGTGRSGTLTSSMLTGLGMGVGLTFVSVSSMNIVLGSGADTFNIQSINSTTVTGVNTNTGTDIVNIGSNAPSGSGNVTGIQGALTVTGNGTDTMNVDDTGITTATTGTLTSSLLTGLGLDVSGIIYSGLSALNISLGSGANTFTISSTYITTVTTLKTGGGTDTVNLLADSGTTNIVTQGGNDTVNIQTTNGTTNVSNTAGADTIYIGSNAPSGNGNVNGIQGTINVTGDGSDTLNVDDTGSTAAKTGTLTASALTGLGMGSGGITYSGLTALNISLGSGGNTFTISNTKANTTTTLNSGSGSDTVYVKATAGATTVNAGTGTNTIYIGSLEPTTGGTVNGIQGALTVNGSGNDTMYVDDTGSTAAKTGTLTATTITGLGMVAAGITYNGITSLTISLGSGGNTFTISNTIAGMTTLNSGTGSDTVNLTTDSGTTIINTLAGNDTVNVYNDGAATTINTGGGNDTVNIQATHAVTNINNSAGADTIYIGSNAPSGNGNVTGIQGTINVTGDGSDTMNVDDTGITITATGTLTSSLLTGLGMGSGGITYSGLTALNISLGSGGNTFTISSTSAGTTTTLNSGTGSDTVYLTTDSGPTIINTQTGTDTVNVANDGGTTSINTGGGNDTVNIQTTNGTTNVSNTAGADTIYIGSNAPSGNGNVNGIQGTINVTGDGSDTLNVDDTGSTAAKTGTLTASALTGLGMGSGGITYSGLTALNISLGSGGNTFTISNTKANTTTTLNSGSGSDMVYVKATAGATTVNAGTGTNTIYIGSLEPTTGGTVNGIQGALTVNGSGNDTLNVDDTGSTTNYSETLTATTITGMGMVAAGITYSGLAALNISLGSGTDTLTVTGVTNTTVTTINGNGGTNTATLNFSGNFGGNLTLLNFATATLTVGGNFSGQLTDAGAVTPVTITGSLTSTGVLSVGSIATMTVGGSMAGQLTVTGLLGTLTVTGGTPGQIVVGSVNVITVLAGTGNSLLNLTSGGIQREITATPVAGGTMPGTVTFQFVYDATTATVPQVAIQITNTAPVTRSFNLALVVVNSATAKFDLSILDSKSGAATGLSNISLQGDLLEGLTAPELQTFTSLTASSRGGIVLPADSITGVEVSDILPIGYVDVAGIEGVAFAILTTASGSPVTVTNPLGSAGNIQVLWNDLGSTPTLNPANDAFVIPFNQTESVRLYAHVDTNPDFEMVMTLTAETTDNLPVTASVQMVSTTNNSVSPLVQSVALTGVGGSINSAYSIANITSTGALGDVTITAPAGSTVDNEAGLGNVTAPSIFGSIDVTNAGIWGVIQTTSGDIGQAVIGTGSTITGVTTITSNGALTGQIISRGNITSSIQANSSFSGVIAAQGNIGVIQTSNGNAVLTGNALTRFGGITIAGADSGQIISLGNVFGNLTISGSMTGRIAVKGAAVAGLAGTRIGILGNITATTDAAGSAIISGGLIGDATGGTTADLGNASGFVAADEAINLASTTITANNELQNVTGSNLAALNAIFTNGNAALSFDTGGTLQGLVLIETDLASIQDTAGVLSGTIP